MNSRKCEICNIDVHRASMQKHLRSKKHIEIMSQSEMIIPEWLFQEPVENKKKRIYNPKSLKQIARNSIKLDDKQLNKELARKMINPYYFSDKNLRIGLKANVHSDHKIHLKAKLTITLNYSEFGIEVRCFNKIMKKLSIFHARLTNQ